MTVHTFDHRIDSAAMPISGHTPLVIGGRAAGRPSFWSTRAPDPRAVAVTETRTTMSRKGVRSYKVGRKMWHPVTQGETRFVDICAPYDPTEVGDTWSERAAQIKHDATERELLAMANAILSANGSDDLVLTQADVLSHQGRQQVGGNRWRNLLSYRLQSDDSYCRRHRCETAECERRADSIWTSKHGHTYRRAPFAKQCLGYRRAAFGAVAGDNDMASAPARSLRYGITRGARACPICLAAARVAHVEDCSTLGTMTYFNDFLKRDETVSTSPIQWTDQGYWLAGSFTRSPLPVRKPGRSRSKFTTAHRKTLKTQADQAATRHAVSDARTAAHHQAQAARATRENVATRASVTSYVLTSILELEPGDIVTLTTGHSVAKVTNSHRNTIWRVITPSDEATNHTSPATATKRIMATN